MDIKTEKILTTDPIGDTEKMFGGKHWSEFNDGESLISILNVMKDGNLKEKHLKNINDTYFGMSWQYLKDLLKENGFINGYSYEVKYTCYSSTTDEEMIIYYHPEKGLVVWAESYSNKTSVNRGTLYGEIKANNEEDATIIRKWMSTGGFIDRDELIHTTAHDIREGLFSKIDTLETGGTFLTKWTKKDRFLWFVDYIETKVEGYDYEQITKDKIGKCPKELQNIIGGINNVK
jgi:hypothetical protein